MAAAVPPFFLLMAVTCARSVQAIVNSYSIYEKDREKCGKIILFDLDGTLTDPKEGITKSVQHALRSLWN